MSTKSPALDESEIARYLIDHPEFFERHPKALAQLQLPDNQSGNISSLVTRQMELWRGRHQSLETTFKTIVQRARENEKRSIFLHRLALGMTQKGDWNNTHEVAVAALLMLRETFPSNIANIFLYGRDDAKLENSRIKHLVKSSFDVYQPDCGPFDSSVKKVLFGDLFQRIASALIMPLGHTPTASRAVEKRFGLLVFGSSQSDSFKPGLGTMFLMQYAELITATMVRAEGVE